MRHGRDPQLRLDCPPIEAVPLNTNCRDEIIPILRALQHVYGDQQLRGEILGLVGKDVNGSTSPKHGRPGRLLAHRGAGWRAFGLQPRL